MQATDHRGDQRGATPRADSDAQFAEFQSLGQADLAVEVAGAGVERPGMAQQQASHVGGLDTGRPAVEQGRPDLCFQRLDAARQRRLGDVRRGGGAAEVAVLGDSDQVTKTMQIHSAIMPHLHQDDVNNALDTSRVDVDDG